MTEQQVESSTPQLLPGSTVQKPIALADNILNDIRYGGSITFPVTTYYTNSTVDTAVRTIPFFMENNLQFSLGNTWEPLIPQVIGESLSTIVNLFSMSSLSKSGDGAQVSLVSKAMNAASWKGSQIPEFQVGMLFVSTSRDYNPVNIIKTIAATCLPRKREEVANNASKLTNAFKEGGIEPAKNWFNQNNLNFLSDALQGVENFITNVGMVAPLGYEIKTTSTDEVNTPKDCTVMLKIGKWFQANKLIVTSMSGIEFSKEIIAPKRTWTGIKTQSTYTEPANTGDSEGFPLYARCSLTLRPITYITYDEFIKYFMM